MARQRQGNGFDPILTFFLQTNLAQISLFPARLQARICPQSVHADAERAFVLNEPPIALPARKVMARGSLGATLAMSTTGAIIRRLRRDFARGWVGSLRVKHKAPMGEDELARMAQKPKSKSWRKLPCGLTSGHRPPIVRLELLMNPKLLFKAVFLLVVLLLLVLMGLNNDDNVTFRLPPLVSKFSQKSAIMYFAFFAVGFLTATVLMAGGGKRGGGGSKPSKSGK